MTAILILFLMWTTSIHAAEPQPEEAQCTQADGKACPHPDENMPSSEEVYEAEKVEEVVKNIKTSRESEEPLDVYAVECEDPKTGEWVRRTASSDRDFVDLYISDAAKDGVSCQSVSE